MLRVEVSKACVWDPDHDKGHRGEYCPRLCRGEMPCGMSYISHYCFSRCNWLAMSIYLIYSQRNAALFAVIRTSLRMYGLGQRESTLPGTIFSHCPYPDWFLHKEAEYNRFAPSSSSNVTVVFPLKTFTWSFCPTGSTGTCISSSSYWYDEVFLWDLQKWAKIRSHNAIKSGQILNTLYPNQIWRVYSFANGLIQSIKPRR